MYYSTVNVLFISFTYLIASQQQSQLYKLEDVTDKQKRNEMKLLAEENAGLKCQLDIQEHINRQQTIELEFIVQQSEGIYTICCLYSYIQDIYYIVLVVFVLCNTVWVTQMLCYAFSLIATYMNNI